MLLSNAPQKLVLAFAVSGGKNVIPVASQIGITGGAASLTDGFPPLTRTPVAAGGIPPFGLDMNGILFDVSAITRWANAGAGYVYDGTFANDSNVSGYPKGARILRSDGQGYWLNLTDSNVTDPEATTGSPLPAAAGWVPDTTNGIAAITMTNANVTLTPLQYGRPIVVITGTLSASLNLIFPNISQEWTVVNNTTGAFSITAKTAAGTGVVIVGTQIVYGDGTNIYAGPGGTSSVRTRLTADTSFYIATTGNDTTGGGTISSPWLTINKGITYIQTNIDLAGFTATVKVADGTYSGGISVTQPFTGAGSVKVIGNVATPANCIISTTGGTHGVFILNTGVVLNLVDGFTITSSATDNVIAIQGAFVGIGTNMILGASGGYKLVARGAGAVIGLTGGYTSTGNAVAEIAAEDNAELVANNNTITLTGTPAYSSGFAVADTGGLLVAYTMTFVGSATGPRYNTSTMGNIYTNGAGATYFPGNAGGVGTSAGTSPFGLYT